MSSRFLIVIALMWSAGTLFLPGKASAATPLTEALVETTRNDVLVQLKKQNFRPAKAKKDKLLPNDALQTGAVSLAELRFNDRSLARIGEKALFEFQPGTRDIRLERGTVLLLIQPKQGRTRVRTPNAAAGIRGSALFVRFIPNADPKDDLGPITIVGALTNSDIEVSNQDGSQKYVLRAGQMAVVHRNAIGLYTFDLNSFYATSALAQGLDLDKTAGSKANLDQTIADVRAETLDALKALPSTPKLNSPTAQPVAANPAWMLMSPPTAQAPQSTNSASTNLNPAQTALNYGSSAMISSLASTAEILRGMMGVGTSGSQPVPPTFPGGVGVIASPPPSTPTPPAIVLPGPAAAITPDRPEPTRPIPQAPPTPSPITNQPPAQPPVNTLPIPAPPPAAAPTPTTPVVTPPTPAPPVVVTPPVTTPPVVEPPTVPGPAAGPPRPTPATPATTAPGVGVVTPANPASPASPAAGVNVTVSQPTVDLPPVQLAIPATPAEPNGPGTPATPATPATP